MEIGKLIVFLSMRFRKKPKEFFFQSLYYMVNRIRKKVKLIRQCGGHLQDNLTNLDLKIHEMSAADDYNVESQLEDIDFSHSNGNLECDTLSHEQENIKVEGSSQDNSVDRSSIILVARSAEELSRDWDDTMIVEEADDIIENPNDYTEESSEFVNQNIYAEHSALLSDEDTWNGVEIVESHDYAEMPTSSTSILNAASIVSVSSRGMETQPSAYNATHNFPKPNNALEAASKTGVRIPEIQKERLVQLLQGDFLKAFGRFAGSNGTFIKASLWKRIADELNKLGPPRTAEQWKQTFNNIKSGAKAKLADEHNRENGTPKKPLTRLEEKIVSMYGMDNMDGDQNLGEGGFVYNKTVPANTTCRADVVTMVDDDGDEANFVELNDNRTVNTESDEEALRESEIRATLTEPESNGFESNVDSQIINGSNVSTTNMTASQNNEQSINRVFGPPGSTTYRGSLMNTLQLQPTASPSNNQNTDTESTPLPSATGNNTNIDGVTGLVAGQTHPSGSTSDRGSRMNASKLQQRASRCNDQNTNSASSMSLPVTGSSRNFGGVCGRVVDHPPSAQSGNRVNSGRHPCAPPKLRQNRNANRSSPIQHITNVNQFFNDNGDTDSDDSSSGRIGTTRRANRNNPGQGSSRGPDQSNQNDSGQVSNGRRDRSNLRNVSSNHALRLAHTILKTFSYIFTFSRLYVVFSS